MRDKSSVIDSCMDRDRNSDQYHGDEDPAQGVEVGHQGQDGGLFFRQNVLRDFDTGAAVGAILRYPV